MPWRYPNCLPSSGQGFTLALMLVFALAFSLIAMAALQLAHVETLVNIRVREHLQAQAGAAWALANAERALQGLSPLLWTQSTAAPTYTIERLGAAQLGIGAAEAAVVFIYRITTRAQVGNRTVRLESLFSPRPMVRRLSWHQLDTSD